MRCAPDAARPPPAWAIAENIRVAMPIKSATNRLSESILCSALNRLNDATDLSSLLIGSYRNYRASMHCCEMFAIAK
jgi:hypothetical protein